jgi:hypothetical protein
MANAVRNTALGTFAFNPYAAGVKRYGVKTSPNIGPVDKTGYAARDRQLAAKKKAINLAMKKGNNLGNR